MTSAAELLSSYLRQRMELGEDELIVSAPLHLCKLAPCPAGSSAPVPAEADAAGESGSDLPARRRLARPAQDTAAPTGPAASQEQAAPNITPADLLAGLRLEGPAEVRVLLSAPVADGLPDGEAANERLRSLLEQLFTAVGITLERAAFFLIPPAEAEQDSGGSRSGIGDSVRQQLVKDPPRVILACGADAARVLLETNQTIAELRGESLSHGEIPVVATHSPAALLRNPSWIRPVWSDLQRLRALLDGPAEGLLPHRSDTES